MGCEEMVTLIDKWVAEVNKHAVSNAATLKKWRILPYDFSEVGGELTPILKFGGQRYLVNLN